MSRVRRAIVFSALSGYSLQIIGLISTMVVARILTPDEIGTFAIASAIVVVISEFRVLGAGVYLVREEALTQLKVRSALGLTLLISWGLGAAVFLSAPFVADFYNLNPIKPIFRILSLSFIFAPLISIPFALFSREMKFDVLFKVQLVGALVSLITTVVLMLLGMSYFSLAWGYTASIVAQFSMFALIYRHKHMTYIPVFSNMWDIMSLGIFNSLSNLLKRGVQISSDMVIGKLGTTYQVGIFSRGLGFTEFISRSLIMGIGPIALPYLSDTKREGGDLGYAFQRASILLGGMVIPVLIVGSLSCLPAIRLFFGDQWDAAAPIAAYLSLWSALRAVLFFSNDLCVATGHERAMFYKDGVAFITVVIAIFAGFPYGLERIGQLFLIAGVLELLVAAWLVRRYTGMSTRTFFKGWLPNVWVSIGCLLMTLLIRYFVDFGQPAAWRPILTLAVIMPPTWLLLLYMTGHPLLEQLMHLLPGRKKAYEGT